MNKLTNRLIIFTFLIFIFGFSLLNLVTPDREKSESENRLLQQFPHFSLDRLLSGDYTRDFDKYMTDQFVLKDHWVGLKSDFEQFVHKSENNGVYFAKDGYLLEKFSDKGEYFDINLQAINSFHNKMEQLNTTVMLVPTAVKIYEDKLPLFAPTYDQEKMLSQAQDELKVRLVDVMPILMEHKEEAIYYRTDHHWTTLGAFYAYQQLLKEWGINPYLDYHVETVTHNFYGTHYFKANDHRLKPDEIHVYYPNHPVDFSLTFPGTGESLDGLYNYDYLDQRDKYSLFINGNQALTVIKSNVENGQKLVMFKDSYAHNFVPFLAMHFEEIHLIDLRYFNLNPYDYIREHEFTQALFLYNLSSFGTDSTIKKLKAYH